MCGNQECHGFMLETAINSYEVGSVFCISPLIFFPTYFCGLSEIL